LLREGGVKIKEAPPLLDTLKRRGARFLRADKPLPKNSSLSPSKGERDTG
jgi:hypothetical protein